MAMYSDVARSCQPAEIFNLTVLSAPKCDEVGEDKGALQEPPQKTRTQNRRINTRNKLKANKYKVPMQEAAGPFSTPHHLRPHKKIVQNKTAQEKEEKTFACPCCQCTYFKDTDMLDHFIKHHCEIPPKLSFDDLTSSMLQTNTKKLSFRRRETPGMYPERKHTYGTVLDFTNTEWDNIFQTCFLQHLLGYDGFLFILETLTLRHIYQSLKMFLLLSGDVEQNPGPQTRLQLGESLFDDSFNIPNKKYTLEDHDDRRYVVHLQQTADPVKFTEQVAVYNSKCTETSSGHADSNSCGHFINTNELLPLGITLLPSNVILNPDCPVYTDNPASSQCDSGNSHKSVVVTTNRPELGSQSSSVKLRIHNISEVFTMQECNAKKRKSKNINITNIVYDQPWMENVLSNISRCKLFYNTELTILKNFFETGFLSEKNKFLIDFEDKAYYLAAYPNCTEGVILFNVFTCVLDRFSEPLYYVRFLESGCYENSMKQIVLDFILTFFNTSEDFLVLSQIVTTDDICKKQEKVMSTDCNRRRPDKVFSSNCNSIRKLASDTITLASRLDISINCFFQIVKKSKKQSGDASSQSNIQMYNNFGVGLGDVSDLLQNIKEFPCLRVEEMKKTEFDFTEEIISENASILLQSHFLNYLSNEHHYCLEGKPLRFRDRFVLSINAKSFRNRALNYISNQRTTDLINLFRSCRPDSIDNISQETEDVHVPKRKRKPSVCVHKRIVTRDMLRESLGIASIEPVENMAQPESLFEYFKRQMMQIGTLEIQVLTSDVILVVLNDYSDEDGTIKEFNYVYTRRILTEAGFVFICTCSIYRTLLEWNDNHGSMDYHIDVLDVTNGVKCMHCRYLCEEVIPNLVENDDLSAETLIKQKVKTACLTAGKDLLILKGKSGTKKFSVLTDEEYPSMASITYNNSTGKYVVSCHNGYCRSSKGAKKNIDSFITDNLCQHLKVIKENPECWTSFKSGNVAPFEIDDADYEEVNIPEPDIEALTDIIGSTEDEVSVNDPDFDSVSGLWSFPCVSDHSPKDELDPDLSENVKIRDTWNDKNPACAPRIAGCLQGPDFVPPLPSCRCTCGSSWVDESGEDIIKFERRMTVYTEDAPVLCNVYSRYCSNRSETCKLSWDEGKGTCIHVLSKDTAAGDEIGWSFVNQVLTSHITFSSFCSNKTKTYKIRDPLSRKFMSSNVFIAWWFSWAANMKVDFRKPCPVCKYEPKQLACDGTKIGIGFRHAHFEPIYQPKDTETIVQCLHKRLDRCFIQASDEFESSILDMCRQHLDYLASLQLNLITPDFVIPDDVLNERNTILKTVLPTDVLPSFNRFLNSMVQFEKDAYADILKVLSTTAPLNSLLPSKYCDEVQALLNHLTGDLINPAGESFLNKTLFNMRYYSPEIRNLITGSMIHSNTDGKLHDDIALFLSHLIERVKNLPVTTCEPATPQEGTYNPMKYGRAYYFSESGCKLRNIRKFSLDKDHATNDNRQYDDRPMDHEFCQKYFSKAQVSARGTTTLFLWFCPNHGHCYGFHMTFSEGRRDPFASLYTHLQHPPDDIFYDFACNLQEYCLNRESGYFKNVRFFHDIFHGYAHKCSKTFKSSRLSGMECINSEICEQFNSFMQCIKASARQMNQKHFCFFLQFFLNIWNDKKDSKVKRKLMVALKGVQI